MSVNSNNLLERFLGKRVTVMGLGVSGAGAAAFFARAGAKVTVTDLKTKRELAPFLKKLKGLQIRYALGGHRMRDFTHADLVIYSMGLRATYTRLADSPYLAAAIQHHVPLDTDIGIFFELVPRERIIGVTGTRGKSTTAALIAHILKQKYPGTILAGNIRTSVLARQNFAKQNLGGFQPIVLELSSWQLEILEQHKKSPHIAVMTSIFKDHLNRYPSFRAYLEAKKNILRYQKQGDIAVLNEQVKKETAFRKPCGKGRRVWTSWRDVPSRVARELKLPGLHNLSNLACALAVVRLYDITEKNIIKALRTFRGLEGRFEVVRKVRGITFVNDTTATAPEAVIAALKSLRDLRRIILICGGVDKNLDYEPLAQFLVAYPPKAVVLLPGTATGKLCVAMSNVKCQMSNVFSMREAVRAAWHVAKKGDTILLSPGAASFNLFQNEFDRGEQFVREVKSLR